MVTQACNLSSRGRGGGSWSEASLREKHQTPSEKQTKAKRARVMTQVQGPEFKPHYLQKRKKKKYRKRGYGVITRH
jgi:hypothetical protein